MQAAKANGAFAPAGGGRWSRRRTFAFVMLASLLLWLKIAGGAWALAVRVVQAQELRLVSEVVAPLFHAGPARGGPQPLAGGKGPDAVLDLVWQRPIWRP